MFCFGFFVFLHEPVYCHNRKNVTDSYTCNYRRRQTEAYVTRPVGPAACRSPEESLVLPGTHGILPGGGGLRAWALKGVRLLTDGESG